VRGTEENRGELVKVNKANEYPVESGEKTTSFHYRDHDETSRGG